MTMESLEQLRVRMADLGAKSLLIKPLAENDNSKNQVYLGTDYDVLREIPSGELKASDGTSTKRERRMPLLKASLDFCWIDEEYCSPAPGAQLILYPQYPEVRLSGFLRGCDRAPSGLMGKSPGLPGRILFLGIADKRILAHVAAPDSPLGRDARNRLESEEYGEIVGVFRRVLLPCAGEGREDDREAFLRKLADICRSGWISSRRLRSDGSHEAYTAQNGAGYTLEALCGILPNGLPLPDYLGWELKATATKAAFWPGLDPGARITLMTPEPTLGVYAHDIDLFRERYARLRDGDPGCMYFTGNRYIGREAEEDNLVMRLEGIRDGRMLDGTARIILVDRQREDIAAGWALADILEHWRRKHARTAYVPYEKQGTPPCFRYGSRVRLGEGCDFSLILKAFSDGIIVHDPGVKFTKGGNGWRSHRRNQFRTLARHIPRLYRTCSDVTLE